MKILVVLASVLALVASQHHTVQYAHCMFGNQGDVTGHICFSEQNGPVEAHIQVSGVETCTGYKVHIHENAPGPDGSCASVGGHYNWADDLNDDEGNMGVLSSNSDGIIHKHVHAVHGDLSLNGEHSIVGRSVSIHIGGHKVCCPIVDCTKATFDSMTSMVSSYVHPKIC